LQYIFPPNLQLVFTEKDEIGMIMGLRMDGDRAFDTRSARP